MKSLNKILVLSTVLTLGATLAGCGKGNKLQFVKDVQLKTYQKDNDSYGQVKASLDTGNIELPAFELPIMDPRNPAVTYGAVALRYNISGLTDLVIDINLTDVAQVPGTAAMLPNGTALPVGGLDGVGVIQLPVANTGAQVYVAFGTGVALIGTAVPIREFNSIGGFLGGMNLFIPFNIVEGVRGVAGLFTGRQSGQNGFAFFVDAGKLIQQQMPGGGGNGLGVASFALSSIEQPAVFRAATSVPSRLSFRDIKPSSSKENKLKSEIYRMHLEGKRTHLN